MKRYLTILFLLCTIGTVNGAHFSYYAGGFRAYYQVYAQQDYPYLYDGPWSQTQDSTTAAWVEGSATVTQARSYARNNISSKTSNNSILINLYSISDCAADNSSSYTAGWGYGTTQNYQTYGIFYKIMPDANEQIGDDAIVYYNDIVFVSASGTTHLVLGGPGTMDHIAITRGQLPPVTTEPLRENEVLRFPYVELSNSGGDWFSGVHTFPAKIGDVIGIFAQNRTDIIGWGPLAGSIYSSFIMTLTVETVLLGDLDYDDDVDLYDLAKLANNWLIDIGHEPIPDTTPPEPNPMQWDPGPPSGEPREIQCPGGYCATMKAKTATDPSGGVQYYFECTDYPKLPPDGFSSGWQGSPSYTVLVSIYSGKNYRFRVKARDLHGNETAWSPALPMN
jgi:hypothetical protein